MCYNSVTAMMQKSRPVHGAALEEREYVFRQVRCWRRGSGHRDPDEGVGVVGGALHGAFQAVFLADEVFEFLFVRLREVGAEDVERFAGEVPALGFFVVFVEQEGEAEGAAGDSEMRISML